ncbi:unnamed protein product [Bursaphelenchus xylophilus]|uniref:(pine wood nematode) hypothetical protein n=1 Tax=Bursaphelenchus xylophilus TaxID=6326 RepID=A0A1I7RUU3_BURXY|nr:unnamed protein product [Bursaphelenchus xylophilus]CAG9105443.1 unnamed protein product [Bursaphelenchus xylophilus]
MGYLLTAYANVHPKIDLTALQKLSDYQHIPQQPGKLAWRNGHLVIHQSRLVLTVDGPFREQIRRFQAVLADLQKIEPRSKIRSYGLSHRTDGRFRGYLINFWTPPCSVNVHYEPEISGTIYAKLSFPKSPQVRLWIAESGAIEMAKIRDSRDLVLGQECIKSLQVLAKVGNPKKSAVEVTKPILQPRINIEEEGISQLER